MRVLLQIVLVCLGSSLGGLSRWGASVLVSRYLGTAFPYGTFIINIVGSFILGWFMTFLTQRYMNWDHVPLHPEDLRLLVAVGFTGAFTTFSTFEYESDVLFKGGQGLTAILYISLSVGIGLLAMRAGISLAEWGRS